MKGMKGEEFNSYFIIMRIQQKEKAILSLRRQRRNNQGETIPFARKKKGATKTLVTPN